jgi:signal transduction histidine kinase
VTEAGTKDGEVRFHLRLGGSEATVTVPGSSSTGLAGLTDRVRTVDGHLDIASPPGGPTAITVDRPGPA